MDFAARNQQQQLYLNTRYLRYLPNVLVPLLVRPLTIPGASIQLTLQRGILVTRGALGTLAEKQHVDTDGGGGSFCPPSSRGHGA